MASSDGSSHRIAGGAPRRRDRDAALSEQMRQVMSDMQTAAHMLSQSSRELLSATDSMGRRGGRYSNTQYDPMGVGHPRTQDNQSRRPQHYTGRYPGGSLGQARQMARNAVAAQIHNRRGGRFRATNWDEQGNATHYDELDHTGKVIDTHAAESISGRLTASRIAGGLSHGGVLGAVRATPYVGEAAIAVGGLYEGAQFVSNQRAADAQYQSILGGSNMAGMGQRFLGQGYRLNQLFTGGFNGAQSDQVFKGVTALGYQGGARQSRLNFASNNYRSMGMGPDESLRLIAIASQTTTTSLSDLEKQLKAVSDMAKETTQNAAALRAQYTTNFQALAQAGAGGGAGLIAQAQVGLTSGMGRQYANANLTGLSSTSSLLFQANQLGMGLGQYMAQNQQTGGMTFAQGQQAQLNWAVRSASGSSDTQQQIQAAIDQAGGSAKVAGDANLQARIAMQLMGSGVLQPLAIGNILSSMSVDVSKISGGLPGQAAYLIGLIAKGRQSLVSQVSQGQSGNARRSMTSSEADTLYQSTHRTYTTMTGGGSMTQTSNSANAVQSYELAQNTRDPALEQIYANEGGGNAKITFADGRTVPLKNALKNSDYVKQIDQGSATLASGGDKGKSISQLGWSSVGTQVGQPDSGLSSGLTGQVGVTVSMDPQARAILAKLGIVITGNDLVEQGAKANSPIKPGG